MKPEKEQIIIDNWNLNDSFFKDLPEFSKDFILGEMLQPKTIEYYISRLQNIGFQKMDNVLDSGCGIGQWATCLAKLNTNVVAIDPMLDRLKIAEKISSNNECSNIKLLNTSIESNDLPDSSFDGIFCYGVFMFTDTSKAIEEFYRLLKPGGQVYFNFNNLGWYMHLILDRGLLNKEYGLMKNALKMVLNYLIRKDKMKLLRTKDVKNMLEKANFSNISIGKEGELAPLLNYNESKHGAFYPDSYYGLPSVTEIIAIK